MQDLSSIKKKIENYKKIRQITEATRLASITGFSLCNKKLTVIKNALDSISGLVQLKADESLNSHATDINLKCLIIIIGTYREMPSNFIIPMQKCLQTMLKSVTPLETDVVLLGKGSRKLLEKVKDVYSNLNIIKEELKISLNESINMANNITNIMMDQGLKYSKCLALNMHFKNFFTQEARVETILPIKENKHMANKQKPENHLNFIWEQKDSVLTHVIIEKYFDFFISYLILQALISENANKFISMDKATSSADEFINQSTILMNKIRQINITKQMTELSTYSID